MSPGVQSVLVFVTVALASLYLFRKLFGPVARRRPRGRPDVPVNALVRKKRAGAGRPHDAPSPGCDH